MFAVRLFCSGPCSFRVSCDSQSLLGASPARDIICLFSTRLCLWLRAGEARRGEEVLASRELSNTRFEKRFYFSRCGFAVCEWCEAISAITRFGTPRPPQTHQSVRESRYNSPWTRKIAIRLRKFTDGNLTLIRLNPTPSADRNVTGGGAGVGVGGERLPGNDGGCQQTPLPRCPNSSTVYVINDTWAGTAQTQTADPQTLT